MYHADLLLQPLLCGQLLCLPAGTYSFRFRMDLFLGGLKRLHLVGVPSSGGLCDLLPLIPTPWRIACHVESPLTRRTGQDGTGRDGTRSFSRDA